MAQAGGRAFVAMMETLEGRQLLSFDALAPITDGDAERSLTALTATTDPVAAAATVTSLHIVSPDVEEGSPVTLDAVVRTHGSFVPVTESVAFLAISTPDDAPRYVGFAEVQIARPESPGPEMAFVLGTAAVGPDGTARLELPSMPLGPHSIVAMFLGNDTPIFGASGDLPRISPSAEPQQLVTWRPNGPEEVRSWIVEPGGKAFQIRWGMIMFLGEAPEGAHVIPAAGVHVHQIEGYRYNCSGAAFTWCADDVAPPATFAPMMQPLRIIATARGGLSRAAYRYEIVPVGLPETIQDKAEDLASSASQPQLLSVKATTDLRLYLGGETTVTNPPAIMGALRRTAGPMEYFLPSVPNRGSMQSATAGLRVIVPGSGGSSGSGGVTYGMGVVRFGGGSSSYSNGTNYVSPRQPRIPNMTGTLTFFDGDALLGSAPLTDRRSALFHAAPGSLALGAHQIRVVYSGDAAHRPDDEAVAVEIIKTPTALKLESSAPSGSTLGPGQVLELKATVSTLVADLVKPTGYVRFYANGEKLGKALLGSERSITFRLPGGNVEITAVFAGNKTMQGSASAAAVQLTVVKPRTNTWASVKKAEKRRDRPIVLTPVVSAEPYGVQPRGKVVLEVDGKKVASAKPGGKIKLKAGRLREGTHHAVLRYLGDKLTQPSTSPRYEVVVTQQTASFIAMVIAAPVYHMPVYYMLVPMRVPTHHASIGQIRLPTVSSYPSGSASADGLVRYTYTGDANIDGTIDSDDYFVIDDRLEMID